MAFLGPGAAGEAASMRYGAHNVIEALALAGVESGFFALEEAQTQLPTILSHDLIVQVRLVIVGSLDLSEFPGLAPVCSQIDLLPLRPWTELPAAIAGVDINLIPLEQTPFNDGKSNLKYFEAALLKVPSIASPTRIHRESIRHGHNGLLAGTPEEWCAGLQELAANPQRREQMGQHAYEHVLKHYSPEATAAEAVAIYREILDTHRGRHRAA